MKLLPKLRTFSLQLSTTDPFSCTYLRILAITVYWTAKSKYNSISTPSIDQESSSCGSAFCHMPLYHRHFEVRMWISIIVQPPRRTRTVRAVPYIARTTCSKSCEVVYGMYNWIIDYRSSLSVLCCCSLISVCMSVVCTISIAASSIYLPDFRFHRRVPIHWF